MPVRRSTSLASALTGIALVATLLATAPGATAAPLDPALDGLLQQRLDNPRIGADVALMVIDAATGELVSAHDPDALQLPASNMKIVTAVTALATLGADARLTTRVRSTPTPGEVVLQGGGDPMLTSSDLRDMAAAAAAVLPRDTRVTVRVDDDLLPVATLGPGWPGGYVPSVASSVEALGRLGDYSRDPSAGAARTFAAALRDAGVRARVGEPIAADETWPVIAESSTSVGEAVAMMLNHSENNVAEVLYRQVALARGLPPTWEGGRAAAEAALAALGIDAAGMRLMDGSGLSRKNRVSARFLAQVLRTARVTQPAAFARMFRPDAMPVSGQTGTLDDAYGRFVTRPSRCAQGAVHAKTGTLFDTIGLSGIAETTAGGERIFSILVNDRPQRYSALATRQALDGLAATITGCWS